MQTVDSKLTQTVSRIAGIVAVLAAIFLPLGYFFISHQYQVGMLDAQAEINARLASQVISINPELWRSMSERLNDLLSRRARGGYAEIRRIFDNDGKVVAESVDAVDFPTIGRSAELRDFGVVVGRIEIIRSLRPVLVRTAGVAFFAFLLSSIAFYALKMFPLRALDRAMAENKQLLGETENRAQELERANKTKDEFLSIVSHELKTPLNVVIGYSSMLKEGRLGKINSEQEKALGKVLDRAKDQLNLINSILQASQISAGTVNVIREDVDLAQFIDKLKLHYDFPLNKEITLEWRYSCEFPILNTDSDKLKYILQNLIDNAIKFTDKGTIIVSVQSMAESRVIEFKVTDTGVGIPKAKLPIIFEMFSQADSSENRSFEGVGLGLYIVKMLTEYLGGHVEVESKEGHGSTFIVTLPASSRIPREQIPTPATVSPLSIPHQSGRLL